MLTHTAIKVVNVYIQLNIWIVARVKADLCS